MLAEQAFQGQGGRALGRSKAMRKEDGAVLHIDPGEIVLAHPVVQLYKEYRQIVLVQSEDGADVLDSALHVREAGPDQLGKKELSMLD